MKEMIKPLKEMSLEELWELFPIYLEEYNFQWKKWFLEEQKSLWKLLGNHALTIRHGGSTAVEGLVAKPTVDIFAEMDWEYPEEAVIQRLEHNGWILMTGGDWRASSRLLLGKGYTEHGFEEKVFHLHLRKNGDCPELYFRDYLRKHGETAAEYGKLKEKLSREYRHDRDGYTEAKGSFVKTYTEKGRKEFAPRYGYGSIEEYRGNKKELMPLLLLGDEQESMIHRYLEQGNVFVCLLDGKLVAECVVVDGEASSSEIKNLAVFPEFQRLGCGKRLLNHVADQCAGKGKEWLYVGTGETRETLSFYESCGFVYSHRLKDFFLQYDPPVVDRGILLRDMIMLKKRLNISKNKRK